MLFIVKKLIYRKNMNKKLVAIIVIAIVVLGGWMALSKNNKDVGSVKQIKVGVSQIISHQVMDDVLAGIKIGFEKAGYKEGEGIIYDVQNAQGDSNTNVSIAQKFANSDYDLFMPFGTQSSQAIANLIKDKPVVFAAVTDPITAGLVKSNENPGGNITGTSDVTLYKEQLELLKKLVPSAQKVGIVYNPGEDNSKYGLEQAKKYGEQMGLQFLTAPANNSGEVLSAALSIADKVDAFYMLPDNTVITGQEALIKVATEAKKPLISIDQSGVEKGALATLGTNYVKVGERTAEVAIRVLKGESPVNVPVLGVTDADLFINTATAEKIGLVLSEEMVSSAKQVYK